MRLKIEEKFEIPEGIEINISDNSVTFEKQGEKLQKKIRKGNLDFEIVKKGDVIELKSDKATKREKKMIKTILAHFKNMAKGLQEKFTYELQICFVHFPVTVSVENDEIIIKNFLGERKPRKAKIMPGVEVKVEKEKIKVESTNKENAGQTAANIERATKIKLKDRRVFQDGIFIVSKPK